MHRPGAGLTPESAMAYRTVPRWNARWFIDKHVATMPSSPLSSLPPGKPPGAAESGIERAHTALRLPLPVPLLLQLCRPLHTMDDVESLAAHLDCARARGCF